MRLRWIALGLAVAVAALTAWGLKDGRGMSGVFADLSAKLMPTERSKGAGGAPQAGPPPEVSVSRALQRSIIEWDEYTGRFDATEAVELRARVNGYLTEINFVDGQDVKKGDPLFVIDPRPYERALAQAQAELEQARVKVSNAELDVDRGKPLARSNVISQKSMDDRENLVRDANAAVRVAETRVKLAELDLSYTRIAAPIAGRIGRKLVTVGNYVSGGSGGGSTLLTTIVSQDPIYIYFDVSENDAIKYKRLVEKAGGGDMLGAKVGVGLVDEPNFPHMGKLDFIDNRLDAGTGTLRSRAVVQNPKRFFSPGMFARLRLAGSAEYVAMLLPDDAIATDQTSRYVLVVGDDGLATRRPIKLGPLVDGMRIVREGISADEWVVVRGQARIRPGMKVAPKQEPLKMSEAGTPTGSIDGVKVQKP